MLRPLPPWDLEHDPEMPSGYRDVHRHGAKFRASVRTPEGRRMWLPDEDDADLAAIARAAWYYQQRGDDVDQGP